MSNRYGVLKGGYNVAILFATAGFGLACRTLLYVEAAPNAWLHFYGCGLIGTVCAYAFVFLAQVAAAQIYVLAGCSRLREALFISPRPHLIDVYTTPLFRAPDY